MAGSGEKERKIRYRARIRIRSKKDFNIGNRERRGRFSPSSFVFAIHPGVFAWRMRKEGHR
jgi:hypothetical protein